MSTPDQEECAIIPRELREAIARIKGHALVEDDACVKAPASKIYPVTAAVWKNPMHGQQMPDGTIFLGKCTPAEWGVSGISQTFNIFAAPQDLQLNGRAYTMPYNFAVELLSRARNFHGYDGAAYKNDTELYEAIRNGSYNGEWVIPPRELLAGTSEKLGKDVIVQPDNLMDHKNSGAFKDTIISSGYDSLHDHWSSTEKHTYLSKVYKVRFRDKSENWHDKKDVTCRALCRPVRLVPCKIKPSKPGA